MNTQLHRAEAASEANTSETIVFFDGVCGLCNSFVDFALPRDKHRRLQFAPLQGETAELLLRADQRNLDTVVLRTADGVYTHSSAIVRVLWRLGGLWPLAGALLWLFPKPLRNLGYRIVASQRYRFWNKKESCRLPSQEEAGRILP